ncbi:MAG TPA: 2-dehydropantoate 2-reductase, partial [Burkholderiaceae bacterium]|nr:2-dehydropantoate 2-reductase [Burkholderiaceae bacterium]
EMPAPGVVAHHGRGDLVIGARDAAAAKDAALAARMQAVVDLFAAAKVPVRISADVVGELWSKLLVNCAYNAISALSQLPYGRLVALPEVRTLQQAVVREVLDVARAEGHPLDRAAAAAAVDGIAAAMAGQLSSTAQDLARGKPTEIDHLNGSIVRRGAAHGIATPVNQALFALVKLAESARAAA